VISDVRFYPALHDDDDACVVLEDLVDETSIIIARGNRAEVLAGIDALVADLMHVRERTERW
jgi:hypothetical protein